MAIAPWLRGEGPRDKILERGAETLSDVELVAVLLRTGRRGVGVLDCARGLLARFETIGRLLAAAPADLAVCPGVGRARAAELKAVLELARRALAGRMRDSDALTAPGAVRDYLHLSLMGREREVFAVLFLNAQNRVIAFEELFHGTLTQTSVYPREVVRSALRHNAAAAIFAHNHPLC